MALKKSIKQDDGIITTYHRISCLYAYVHNNTSIAVSSYVDEESRNTGNPYVRIVTHVTDYQADMTMEQAYDYLKTLPEFEGAEDV